MPGSKKILITGGSGMIGRRLTTHLRDRGHTVSHMGRSRRTVEGVKTFLWDPERKEIDIEGLRDTEVIIHLAGAGIADKRWNDERKTEILESRTHSARLLVETLRKIDHRVKTFITASGISYYGLGNAPAGGFVESDPPAEDFMARVTIAWEEEVRKIDDPGIRTVMIRTGLTLDREGGALSKLVAPVKFFVGAPLGTGKQYANWIHLDDLCRIYVKAVEDESMRGPFNAVAPNPVTNEELTKVIAETLRRPLWLPPIPAFVIKLIAGEVSEVVLNGGRISSGKIEKAGYDFQFRTVDKALQDLLR